MGNKFFLGRDDSNGSDVTFFVSGSSNGAIKGSGVSVFGGDLVTSGVLNVEASVSNDFVAKIDNDSASAGHVLKLLTEGNGAGSRLLEMEDGDGDIVFRARADGRFGFGPSGVSSMGAGSFVVGIDGGHTSDIAISKRLQHLGDSDTYMDFPSVDKIDFVVGNQNIISMAEVGNKGYLTALGAVISNTSDVNFSVSGSTNSMGTGTPGTAVFGGDVVVSGSLRAREINTTVHKYNPADNGKYYVNFYTNGSGAPGDSDTRMIAPYAGSLVKVMFRVSSACGNTVIGFHTNVDGQSALNGTAEEEVTVDVSSPNNSYTFNFGLPSVYAPGNIIGISVNPTLDPGDVILTAVWEFETYR